MKKIIAISLFLFCSFAYAQQEKIIIAKEAPIENRFSGADFLFGSGSITKSETVYYLIAEDATVCEVKVATWAKTKIGSKYNCGYSWKLLE